MRKYLILSFLFLQLFALTGCSQFMRNRAEIDKIFNTRIVAIDKTAEDQVLYSIATKTAVSSEQGQQGGEKMSDVLVSYGTTVFDAARNMLQYAHKKPHYGHTEFIIFGEDTAKKGILPYLDFISRNQEFRYNAKIYIVKGDTANSFINKANTGGLFLADKLTILEDNAYALSKSSKVTLSETLLIFSKKNVSTFLPVVRLEPSKSAEGPTEGKYDMILESYAIFELDKLIAFLDSKQSRGVNWVTNRIMSGIILVNAHDNQEISMEIIQNKTAIKPHMDENGLQCTIDIKFNTNIAETLSPEKIFTKEGFEYLEAQQEKEVKKEVENILKYAQEINMDIFGIVSKFIIKYPMMKDDLSARWKELFPDIKFNVVVDSKINRTYLIKESAQSQ